MYTGKTMKKLAGLLFAFMAMLCIACIVIYATEIKGQTSGVSVQSDKIEDRSYGLADNNAETTQLSTQSDSSNLHHAHAWVMQVADVPYYYNWEVQRDGIRNDHNFGRDLWSDTLTVEGALKLFATHMSTDPRACAATALGLSKELGFSVMIDEQSIMDETTRVNAAAAHYEADHGYWQTDFNTIMTAAYELRRSIEDIGEYSSACYMVFNGYDYPPTVIVSPSSRTGGHALVFYKEDGSKIRFRLECSFQLVDVLTVTENVPVEDTPTPEITTVPETTTSVSTLSTTASATTTIETTAQIETSSMTSSTTTLLTTESTTSTTTTESTTSAPTTTSLTTSMTTETTTSATESATSTTESTTSTTESATSATESTTTTSETTTQVTTTEPTTTTTLESKDPDQAPDMVDDIEIDGEVGSEDVDTTLTSEPDFPGVSITFESSSNHLETGMTLSLRDGVVTVFQILTS